MTAQWSNSRDVVERVIVKLELTLTTPAHFGNGESGALTDIPLLRDPFSGKPLLTGASIAGALRNFLREYTTGYGKAEVKDGNTLAEKLFGYVHDAEEASYESWLFVDDALGDPPARGLAVELRDGVAIDPVSGTALIDEKDKGHKFDIELLAAGTTFDLGFEVWLTQANRSELLEGLAIVVHGMKEGHIRLGMRKRRGYGKCKVDITEVSRYDMNDAQDVIAWLEGTPVPGALPDPSDKHKGESFVLDATFRLEKSSLLIRSEAATGDSPDMVHLRSWRNGELQPILSGTSLAGVLRGRASKIANTCMASKPKAAEFVDGMFGKRIKSNEDAPSGSLLIVDEKQIELKQTVADRIQSRVKIDRFTGGAYPQALFEEQPLFGKDNGATQVQIRLELRKTPKNESQFDAQVGLLLFVLKDLWTGDVPIGGESSVGRGRLTGESARLTLGETVWELTTKGDALVFGGNGKQSDLDNRFGKAFQEACHV